MYYFVKVEKLSVFFIFTFYAFESFVTSGLILSFPLLLPKGGSILAGLFGIKFIVIVIVTSHLH